MQWRFLSSPSISAMRAPTANESIVGGRHLLIRSLRGIQKMVMMMKMVVKMRE